MTRSLGPMLLLVALALLTSGTAQAADCSCKQWMGCGYGPGYNAPVPPGGCAHGALNNWGRGCCEVPASWRLSVWDGYHGDPCTYHRSLVGAQPDINHMPKAKVYGGPGFLPGDGTARPYSSCQNGGGYYGEYYGTTTIVPTAEPTPAGSQPGAQSGPANAWSRF